MKTGILSLTITAAVMFVADGARSQHYYGGGNAIGLHIDSTRVTIRFDDAIPVGQQQDLLTAIGRIETDLQDDHVIDDFLACSLTTSQGYEAFLDSLNMLPEIDLVEPYYRNDYDSAFLVGQQFCVAFQGDMTEAEIDAINDSYGVVIDHPVAYMPNVFVMRNSKATGMRMLNLANMYYDLDATRYSHPNFSVRPVLSSYNLYDYYADNQPHTKKVIGDFNQASVWDFAGLTDMITVAVIDDGVDDHEDLPAGRVLEGWDFAGEYAWDPNDEDDDPVPGPYQAHGIACAGIIGSSHTTDSVAGLQSSSGVISLNAHTLILPIKIFDDGGNGTAGGDVPASAISYAWQNDADILSNSWAYIYPNTNFDVINDAIDSATLLGRGGRGCPVIFAAGNYAEYFPGQVAYPASHPAAFAVGATELDDDRWYYSQYGPTLDMVAPSGDVNFQGDVWSLDQMSNLGWNSIAFSDCPPGQNDNDYDCHFGGTSAACPVVSGTAALLLARDPDMPAKSETSDYSVYGVLRGSAVTDLESGPINPPVDEYGYGRVDAYRAILSIARGDVDNDGDVTIADVTYLIDHEFINNPPILPDSLLGDVNCNGNVSIGDVSLLIDHFYISGIALPLSCFEFND